MERHTDLLIKTRPAHVRSEGSRRLANYNLKMDYSLKLSKCPNSHKDITF